MSAPICAHADLMDWLLKTGLVQGSDTFSEEWLLRHVDVHVALLALDTELQQQQQRLLTLHQRRVAIEQQQLQKERALDVAKQAYAAADTARSLTASAPVSAKVTSWADLQEVVLDVLKGLQGLDSLPTALDKASKHLANAVSTLSAAVKALKASVKKKPQQT